MQVKYFYPNSELQARIGLHERDFMLNFTRCMPGRKVPVAGTRLHPTPEAPNNPRMKLRYFISSSRFSRNRETVKECVQQVCDEQNISLPQGAEAAKYDCNLDDSTLRDTPKQNEYLATIRHDTDLFIAILDAAYIGYYTYLEILHAYKSYLLTGFPICLILESKQPVACSKGPTDRTLENLSKAIANLSDTYAPADRAAGRNKTGGIPHFLTDYDNPLAPRPLGEVCTENIRKILTNERLKMRQFAKPGREVGSEEIMNRRGRVENGYIGEIYFERSVDREELANPTSSFVLIKGLPGAGKSRALLHYIHNALGNQQIVVLHSHREFDALFDTLFSERNGCYEFDEHVIKEPYYLIIDEIDKFWLSSVHNDDFVRRWERLCDEVYTHSRLHIYATTTLEGYQAVEQAIEPQNTQIITIGALDPNNEDDARIIHYFGNGANRQSLTVGFIVPRRHDIAQTVDQLLQNNYVRAFCMAYKTVCTFSRNSRQLLRYSVMATAELMAMRNQQMDPDVMAEQLTALATRGVIRLFDQDDEIDRITGDYFNFRNREVIEGVNVVPILPKWLTFYFDDILLTCIMEHPSIVRFGQEQVIELMLATFPMTESYSKAITRAEDKAAAWQQIHDRYADQILRDQTIDPEERRRMLSVQISYAPTFETAIGLIETYREIFPLTSMQIGGLYSHVLTARRNGLDPNSMLQTIRKYEEAISEYDLFYVQRRVQLSDSYSEVRELVGRMAPELTEPHGPTIDSFQKYSINALLYWISDRVSKAEELDDIMARYARWNQNNPSCPFSLTVKPVYSLIDNADGQAERLEAIYDAAIVRLKPAAFASDRDRLHFKAIAMGLLIKNATDYMQARSFVERLQPGEIHMSYFSSMIAKWDFKESEDFERLYEDIERLKERFGIELHINSYNSLIRKAPSAFIAQRIVAAMPYRDNYTLNLYLQKIFQTCIASISHAKQHERGRTIRTSYATACKTVQELIPAINPQGVICNRDGKVSDFAGVSLDPFAVNFLYRIFKNDPQWVDTTIRNCRPLCENVRSNENIHAIRIRGCDDYPRALELFRQYEKACLKPLLAMARPGSRPICPICFCNMFRVLTSGSNKFTPAYREEFRAIFEQYRPYISMNSDTASFYYATYFEEIFDGQESTEIAPAFAEEMEQFPQLSYVPYYLLIGCLHKITFEQALAVYDFFHRRAVETGIEKHMPDNKSIVQLCKYIKTDQELIRLQRYLLAGKVEPGKTAGSALYKLCKERRMGYLLGGNNRQTDSDRLKGQIAHSGTVEEIFRLLDTYATEHDATIDIHLFEYALGALHGPAFQTSAARSEATEYLKFLRERHLVRCTQKTYNQLLSIYYPEKEKVRLLAEMREHCPFDIYTYVAIVIDWCCNTELRQEYYDRIIREYGENIAPETFFTALKVELSHVMQTDSRDFSFAVKILREIERRGYTIHRSVFDKLEKCCTYNSHAHIRQEYASIGDIRQFMLLYMLRYVADDQISVIYDVADRNGIDI